MSIKNENWISVYRTTTPGYPGGVVYIKKDNELGAPIAMLPTPLGGLAFKEKQRERARLITIAPELLVFAESIIKIGKGNAPSVGYMESLIEKAETILNKLKEEKK